MIENWIELGIGVLLLISPWVFGFEYILFAQWFDVLCGVVLVVMNAWVIFGKESASLTPVQKPKQTRRATVAINVDSAVKNKRVRKVEQPSAN